MTCSLCFGLATFRGMFSQFVKLCEIRRDKFTAFSDLTKIVTLSASRKTVEIRSNTAIDYIRIC